MATNEELIVKVNELLAVELADKQKAKAKEASEAWTKSAAISLVVIAVLGATAVQRSGSLGSRSLKHLNAAKLSSGCVISKSLGANHLHGQGCRLANDFDLFRRACQRWKIRCPRRIAGRGIDQQEFASNIRRPAWGRIQREWKGCN